MLNKLKAAKASVQASVQAKLSHSEAVEAQEGPVKFENLNAEALASILEHLSGTDGVRVADRRKLAKKNGPKLQKNVFVGGEAVDWLITNKYANTREAAVVIGKSVL